MRLTFTVKYHDILNLSTLFIKNNSQFSGTIIFTKHYLYKLKSHLKNFFGLYSEDAWETCIYFRNKIQFYPIYFFFHDFDV